LDAIQDKYTRFCPTKPIYLYNFLTPYKTSPKHRDWRYLRISFLSMGQEEGFGATLCGTS
jgi:hypothetical protein